MSEPIWVGSPVDVRHSKEALRALAQENDSKYWHDDVGITRVDPARWQKAQEYELATWMQHYTYAESDRNSEHAQRFEQYRMLPMSLGDVLEIGCGPFTQAKTVLAGRSAKSLTLLDPLIDQYTSHPHCAYARFIPPPKLLGIPAEQLPTIPTYDTIICINVLEHVQDVQIVFHNLWGALRSNGILVIGERTYDDLDISLIYDVGHPVRIKKAVLDQFLERFQLIYRNEAAFHDDKSIYFVGRRID